MQKTDKRNKKEVLFFFIGLTLGWKVRRENQKII